MIYTRLFYISEQEYSEATINVLLATWNKTPCFGINSMIIMLLSRKSTRFRTFILGNFVTNSDKIKRLIYYFIVVVRNQEKYSHLPDQIIIH
jgi:hypothetical protein